LVVRPHWRLMAVVVFRSEFLDQLDYFSLPAQLIPIRPNIKPQIGSYRWISRQIIGCIAEILRLLIQCRGNTGQVLSRLLQRISKSCRVGRCICSYPVIGDES
jgi:hypothetical protein